MSAEYREPIPEDRQRVIDYLRRFGPADVNTIYRSLGLHIDTVCGIVVPEDEESVSRGNYPGPVTFRAVSRGGKREWSLV